MNAFFRWIIYHFPHLKGCVVSLLLFCVIELFFQGKVTVSLANHPPPSSSPPSPRPLFSWSSERVWKRWIITASFGRMQTLQVSTRVSLTCLLNTFFNCDFLITVFLPGFQIACLCLFLMVEPSLIGDMGKNSGQIYSHTKESACIERCWLLMWPMECIHSSTRKTAPRSWPPKLPRRSPLKRGAER